MAMANLIMFWFLISVSFAVGSQILLLYFLRSRGVPVKFGLGGTPGYLDLKFIEWCKKNQRTYLAVIFLRIALLISVVLSDNNAGRFVAL